MPTYEERIAQRELLQRKAIAEAMAVGFRDCHAVFEALGVERVNAGGIIRSSLQVASRWITDAGFALEVIVPDGYNYIPKGGTVRLLRRRPARDCGIQKCVVRRGAAI